MNLLFVADPVESFKAYKDSTYVMMREAQRRGPTVAVCEPRHLAWQSGQPVTATVRHLRLLDITPQVGATHARQPWFEEVAAPVFEGITAGQVHAGRLALSQFDAVLMRKDPPFDAEFIYATHLLEQAEREGAKVFNQPAALRDHPEKLVLM